ncbi:MAG: hypothetical protein K0Q95_2086 [Bacteroidota bacterium]|jgi:hypothetical protein|nr:hypothetical protein [Bacteroidota bacterium]
MKKGGCLLVFLFICTCGFSSDADSSVQKPRVLCSFFVNTVGGMHRYPSPYDGYAASSKSTQIIFPVDLRFYFLKNRLGLGFTHLTSGNFGGTGWYRPYHPMVIRNAAAIEDEELFYFSYNFNLPRLQCEKFSALFQINHGISLNAELVHFITLGGLYSLTKNIAVNASLNVGWGREYEKYDLNLGLCFRALGMQKDRATKKQIAKTKRSTDSVSLFKQRFSIELGGGLYTSKAQDDSPWGSDEGNRFYVSTENYSENEFVYMRRSFPLISLGYNKGNHLFQLEGSIVEHSAKEKGGEYHAGFIGRSSERSVALVYSINDLVSLFNHKFRRYTWFASAKLLYCSKFRDISSSLHYYHWSSSYDKTNYKFKSQSERLQVETGFRWQIQKHLYIKTGLTFNTIGFIKGNYYSHQEKLSYHFTGSIYEAVEFSEQKSINYSEWITPDNPTTFKTIDNIFFKLGYSF